ncbi:TPA: hypothetical protein IAB95_03060 [Candidatus Ventrenecus avicola]|nr:hypothetical protein [Candidatus Ventrenecus avicola]
MRTRLDKYLNETDDAPKRTKKNNELYEEIKHSEISNLHIGSNAKVIGDNKSQIDIDKLKDILEKNYQEQPKRRSVKFDLPEEEEVELEKTREYDINAILEKARAEKEVDYEQERLKKIRDTQYDILKNLEVDSEAESKAANEKTKEELLDLINTITLNEKQTKKIQEEDFSEEEDTGELDPLDILSDLRGDENTVVAGAKEFQEELEKEEAKSENSEDLEKKEAERKQIQEALDEDVDDSFYTNSMSFSKKDFDFFDDDENGAGNIVVKILIVIVFIAVVVGIVIFLNEFLNLGWF